MHLTYACRHGIFKFSMAEFDALRSRAREACRDLEGQILHERIEAVHAIKSRTLAEFWQSVVAEAERAAKEKVNYQ